MNRFALMPFDALIREAEELEQQLAEANKLLEAERVISHKWYNNATTWSREKAKAKEEGRAEAQARIKALEDEWRQIIAIIQSSLVGAGFVDDGLTLTELDRLRKLLYSTTYPTEALDKVVLEAWRNALAIVDAEGKEQLSKEIEKRAESIRRIEP